MCLFKIVHKKYGEGIIDNVDVINNLVHVSFIKNEKKTRIFQLSSFDANFNLDKTNGISYLYYNYLDEKKIENEKLRRDNIINLIDMKTSEDCEFRFNGFYHMTCFDNLKNIIESKKLFCRNSNKMITDMSESIDLTDRMIKTTNNHTKDFVRFYFRPKTPTYFYFEEASSYMCILRFNKEIMFLNNAKISIGNARNNPNFKAVNESNIKEIDFLSVFKSSWPFGNDLNIKNMSSTELLIPNEIGLEFLEEVIFKSDENRKLFWENYIYDKKIRFNVNSNVFKRSY